MLLRLPRSEIWQASRQRRCRDAFQIWERLEKSEPESRGFEASWDLAVRRPSYQWIEALAIADLQGSRGLCSSADIVQSTPLRLASVDIVCSPLYQGEILDDVFC